MNWPTFNWGCDWLQLLNPRGYNWLTFTLAGFEFEWDRSLGDLSLRMALLGFHVGISWNYEPETNLRTRLAEMMAEFEQNTNVTLTHAEYKALKEARDSNVPVEDLGGKPMEKAP